MAPRRGKVCAYFNGPNGCRKGPMCDFPHITFPAAPPPTKLMIPILGSGVGPPTTLPPPTVIASIPKSKSNQYIQTSQATAPVAQPATSAAMFAPSTRPVSTAMFPVIYPANPQMVASAVSMVPASTMAPSPTNPIFGAAPPPLPAPVAPIQSPLSRPPQRVLTRAPLGTCCRYWYEGQCSDVRCKLEHIPKHAQDAVHTPALAAQITRITGITSNNTASSSSSNNNNQNGNRNSNNNQATSMALTRIGTWSDESEGHSDAESDYADALPIQHPSPEPGLGGSAI